MSDDLMRLAKSFLAPAEIEAEVAAGRATVKAVVDEVLAECEGLARAVSDECSVRMGEHFHEADGPVYQAWHWRQVGAEDVLAAIGEMRRREAAKP